MKVLGWVVKKEMMKERFVKKVGKGGHYKMLIPKMGGERGKVAVKDGGVDVGESSGERWRSG